MSRLLTSSLDWQRVPKIWEANQICYKRIMLQRRLNPNHFRNQENSALNVQRSRAHHSTKYGRIVEYQYVCRRYCRYVGRTSLKLKDRINQHIPKSIRNNQKPIPKFSQNKIAKKRSVQPRLRNVTQQLDYIFSKTNSAPTTTMTKIFLSLSGQEVHSILQHWKPWSPSYIKTLKNQFLVARRNSSILYKFPTS